MRIKGGLILLSLLAPIGCAAADPVVITIDTQGERHDISPLIYGSNHQVQGHTFRAARRLGGNRLTTYNWEIDASNAGKDYRHNSDRWLAKQAWWTPVHEDLHPPQNAAPAGTILRFHRESLARGAYSLVTVPMAGHVAADADGPVQEGQAAPSARWVATGATSQDPSRMALDDGAVYADQLVTHLVDVVGNATSGTGVRGYSLDNEPALWHKTHPRVRPERVAVRELIERSIDTAKAIKSADADADVYGPALWGITAYASLSDAPDWPAIQEKEGHAWFVDFYLDEMRRASEDTGVRLLDVLDVHWYTEDPQEKIGEGPQAARSAKALYDPQHTEPNWVGKHFSRFLPLLPRLQQSVDQHYPGTKLAISEYDWPMTGTIHGGLAQVDALGAFGKHGVYFAAYHHRTHEKPDQYVGAAFALYRNYDQQGGTFGNQSLPVSLGDAEPLDVYAAQDTESNTVHLVVSNRAAKQATSLKIHLDHGKVPTQAASWFFDAASPQVRPGPAPDIQAQGEVSLTVPPLSAWHVVLTLP